MKAYPTVHQLRLSGKKIKITHLRRYSRYDERTGKKTTVLACFEDHRDKYSNFFLEAKGGETKLTLGNSEDDPNAISVTAECSLNEAYNRKIGVQVAVGRALKLSNNL
jgi:hypothetical protein